MLTGVGFGPFGPRSETLDKTGKNKSVPGMEETMLKQSFTAAAALVMLGAIVATPAQAWSTTHHKVRHHQASTTQSNTTQGNQITSFSSSSGVVTGGVGVNHPSRK
jgi:hypothetical protein